MEIGVRVNGVFLDGIESGSIKLNVTSSSPYSFGESTKAYTASFKVARSQVNDEVFNELLQFGTYRRMTQYEVNLTVGGVELNERFKAKVTYWKGFYNINLTQTFVKASEVGSTLASVSPFRAQDTAEKRYLGIAETMITECYNLKTQVSLPVITGFRDLKPCIMVAEREGNLNEIAGRDVSYEIVNSYKGDNGDVVYPSGNIINFDSLEVPAIGGKFFPPQGYGVSIAPKSNCTLYLDFSKSGVNPPTTVRLKYIDTGLVMSEWALQSKDSNNSHCRYTIASGSVVLLRWSSTGIGKIGIFDSTARLKEVPPTDISQSEAFILAGTISNNVASSPVNALGDSGVSEGKDLLDGLCKANQWVWKLDILNDGINITVKPILHSTVRSLIISGKRAFGDYVQNWSEYFEELETVEDSEGVGNFGKTVFGEWIRTIRVGTGMFSNTATLFECNLPLTLDRNVYPSTFAYEHPFTFFPETVDYFRSDEYLNKCVSYFKAFRDGIDVTIKANIPYFDFITRFKEDGAYYFRQLNCWFYIRSVSDFDIEKGTCKIKMTKLSLQNG